MSSERAAFARGLLLAYGAWIVAFQAVGRYAATLPTVDLTAPLDRFIPLVPEFVWAYELSYLFPLLPLAVVRDGHRLNRALLAALLANLTAFAVYLLIPVAYPLPTPGPTLAGRVLSLEYALDFHPGANKLPSMHVALTWLVWLVCRGQGLGRAGAGLLLGAACLISLSTLFVKQHLVVDVAAGIAWAFAAWAAAGRLYPALAGGAGSAREALGRIGIRAGLPAAAGVPALILARALLGP